MTYAIVFVFVVASLQATYSQRASALVFSDDPYVSMDKTKEPALPLATDSATAKTMVVNKQKSEGQYILDVKNSTDAIMIANITGSVVEEENEEPVDDNDDDDGTSGNDGTLSAVWYLAAFGGLVLFFFVVTCSELFMQNPVEVRRQMDLPHAGYLRRTRFTQRHAMAGGHYGLETPPPPYHLFAPPSYDDLVKSGCGLDKHAEAALSTPRAPPRSSRKGCKKMPDVFIVQVHQVPPPTPPRNVCPYHPHAHPLPDVCVVDEFVTQKDSCGK